MVVVKKDRNSHILIPLCICYKAKGDFCFETDRQSYLHTDFISGKHCGNVAFSELENGKEETDDAKDFQCLHHGPERDGALWDR